MKKLTVFALSLSVFAFVTVSSFADCGACGSSHADDAPAAATKLSEKAEKSCGASCTKPCCAEKKKSSCGPDCKKECCVGKKKSCGADCKKECCAGGKQGKCGASCFSDLNLTDDQQAKLDALTDKCKAEKCSYSSKQAMMKGLKDILTVNQYEAMKSKCEKSGCKVDKEKTEGDAAVEKSEG